MPNPVKNMDSPFLCFLAIGITALLLLCAAFCPTQKEAEPRRYHVCFHYQLPQEAPKYMVSTMQVQWPTAPDPAKMIAQAEELIRKERNIPGDASCIIVSISLLNSD